MRQRNKCSRETERKRERAARTGTMDIVNLTCCLVAALLYYNTLDAGFVYDDSRAILTNQDVLPTTPLSNLLRNDFWGTPMNHGGSHGSYRPLCVLSFRLNYLLGGFRPWGYHLVNLLLHCLATSLVVRLASTLLPLDSAAPRISVAATGLLFASHPIHAEAVAGVVGRADLAACVFYLSSFLCYVAHVAYRDGVSRQLRAEKQAYKGRYQRERGKYHYHCHYHHHDRTKSTSLVVTNETPRHVHGLRQRVVHAHEKRQRSARDKIKDYLIYFLNRFSGNNLEMKGGTSRFSDGDVPHVASVKQWTAMLGCVWFATCAVFSKETGVTVLGVCAAYDLLIHSRRWRGQRHGDIFNKRRSRRMARSLLILLLTLGILLKIRLLQMGPHPPTFSTADNPTARCSSFLTRFLTFSYLPAFNFFLLLWPQWLSFDWGMDAIPRITSLLDPRIFLALVFYCFLYLIVRHSLSVICNVTFSPPEDFLQKEPRIYQNYQGLSGYQKHRRVILDGHLKVSNKQSRCFCSGSSDPEKFLSPCPVCEHNFTNSHHSLLCRNNNNNNNISPVEETGVEECTCQRILVKTSSHVPYSRSMVAHPKRGPSTSRNLNRAELVLLSLAFLTIPFLPATNLFFYVGFVVAERVLYLPSVGYCLLVGVGCHAMSERTSRRLVTLCLALLVVSFCMRTLLRNKDWYDEESLYRSGIHINPPKAYGNLGSVLSSKGRTEEAEWAFRMALRYRVNMADVHYNIGVLLQGKEHFQEAIKSYELAIHYRPSLALAYLNLGQLLERLSRCEEAVLMYRRCSRLDGTGLKDPRAHEATRVSALLHLGRLYADQGRLTEAAQAYQEAVDKMPEYFPPQER